MEASHYQFNSVVNWNICQQPSDGVIFPGSDWMSLLKMLAAVVVVVLINQQINKNKHISVTMPNHSLF